MNTGKEKREGMGGGKLEESERVSECQKERGMEGEGEEKDSNLVTDGWAWPTKSF